MNQPWVGILLSVGFLASLMAFLYLVDRLYSERERALVERHERQTDLSPMALYLSSGKAPTGRTAEILFEAERGYQRRNELRDEIRRQVSDSPSPSEEEKP